LYLAPYISWSSAKISDAHSLSVNEYIKATYQNACLKTGYQFVKGQFVFDTYFGIGYKENVWSEHQNQTFQILDNKDFEPFKGKLKVLVGFNAGVIF
jgi:hypothetical protein